MSFCGVCGQDLSLGQVSCRGMSLPSPVSSVWGCASPHSPHQGTVVYEWMPPWRRSAGAPGGGGVLLGRLARGAPVYLSACTFPDPVYHGCLGGRVSMFLRHGPSAVMSLSGVVSG